MASELPQYEDYKGKGKLSRIELNSIRRYDPSGEDYGRAHICMQRASKKVLMASTTDHSNVFMVAKIIGALGNKVPKDAGVEDEMWLLREACVLQGKQIIRPLEDKLN